MATVKAITAYMDQLLALDAFDDSSNNGLQVGGDGDVRKVCCGVDASLAFFREAAQRGAELVVCHHGVSWQDSLKYITDLNYRRIAFLVEHKIALYAAHLPLDAHPRYGNNALLFKALGLVKRKPFGIYAGHEIGFRGELAETMPYARFKKRVAKVVGNEVKSMDYGRRTVRSVAVVSGGAAAEAEEAALKGIDVYVTGEPSLLGHTLAQDFGLNVVFGGHYATEVFGVRALAGVLRRRFKVQAEFIDLGVRF